LRIVGNHDCSAYLVVVEAALPGEQSVIGRGRKAGCVEVGARGYGREQEADEQEQEWKFNAAWHWRLRWTPR